MQKIGRYVEELLKARVIDELRPTTRAPSEKMTGKPSKKAPAKRADEKRERKEKPRVKQLHRDTAKILVSAGSQALLGRHQRQNDE
ncbi:hypothetical protein MJ565_20515 [Klebsiella pneumoniae]|nr:hypothetical protein MJ565_20515 [Klebsiella pneumoniae]